MVRACGSHMRLLPVECCLFGWMSGGLIMIESRVGRVCVTIGPVRRGAGTREGRRLVSSDGRLDRLCRAVCSKLISPWRRPGG